MQPEISDPIECLGLPDVYKRLAPVAPPWADGIPLVKAGDSAGKILSSPEHIRHADARTGPHLHSTRI